MEYRKALITYHYVTELITHTYLASLSRRDPHAIRIDLC